MVVLKKIKSNWYYAILVALIFQLILILLKPIRDINNPDAKSAIRRAKTESCKKELELFMLSSNDAHDADVNPRVLTRSCPLDSEKQRNIRLGCVSNSTEDLLLIEDTVANATVCLDLCFSYGHSHGGFYSPLRNCYCGNRGDVAKNNLPECSCSDQDMFDWYIVNNGIYYPNRISLSNSNTTANKQIRIAFLLMIRGRSLLQVHRLLKSIYSPTHLYYLHIDKRDSYLFEKLTILEKKFNNIILAKSRFNTIWGGTSLLRMIIDAMGHLLSRDWDYLINLSESDFPIKSLAELESYLDSARDLIFLRSHNMKGYKFIRKQGLDRNFYQCEDRVWRMGNRKLPRGIVYSGGSDWFALPREFCSYIRENVDASNNLVKPLLQIYNFTLLPAESFFHTLAINSKFCDRFVDTNLRLTNWHRKQGCKCQHKNVVDWCGCSPLVYRWSDWNKLQLTNSSSNLFFSRKFDPTISSSIIGAVENQLIHKEPQGYNYDTRYWYNIYTFDNSSKIDESAIILHQFGLFCLYQYNSSIDMRPDNLKTVHLYYNHDRLIGYIFEYCDLSCYQILVERRSEAYIDNYSDKCSNLAEHHLKVIEVNHGFDIGERMFRNYTPLMHDSDIVVYHEWFVQRLDHSANNKTEKIQFTWIDPENSIELIQNVKLKVTSKLTRLTLAHRLNVPKPLKSGQWTLRIVRRNKICLNYSFLVFDSNSFVDQIINQKQFDKFYRVPEVCHTEGINKTIQNSCVKHDWSLFANNLKYEEYGFN